MNIYTLDPICLPAIEAVKRHYLAHPQWAKDVREGKMFGVLVYEGGYLAAFSGTLGGQTIQPGFVPPVFNLMSPGNYFLQEEAAISSINHRLREGNLPASEICDLKHQRKVRSQALQQWLFSQYTFLNSRGESRSLHDIFASHRMERSIPSGSGDCCAPKLLQEAFRRGIRPLAIAEWNSADNQFYPPCMNRCRPILGHMLQGMDVDPDPLMQEYMQIASSLKIVYQDDDIIVVDKPSGLLSVPGKDFYPSVETLLPTLLGGGNPVFMVHRLDQDTSGLMVVARNLQSQVILRSQFEKRQVSKQYMATLENPMTPGTEGDITLPLRPDIDNRPYQIVDPVNGKSAVTHYQVIDPIHIILTPHTGRTHQLRVHCSHPQGLGNPILGDRLYGTQAPQQHFGGLHLCAVSLSFTHPVSGQIMNFNRTSEATIKT